MAIAIIIGTHGAAAEQLLKTAEMLLGEQDNVAFIDFVPGENAETLIVKYNEKSVGWTPAVACCSVDTGRQPVQRRQPHCGRQRKL